MTTVFHRLGPYEITREIGRGGMAVVFLAVDTRTGREAALKTVPEGTDREAREIFEAEQSGAELQRQFSGISEHVPAVYEHGVEGGYFYVAMEYLDGENLSDVISRGPLTIERAIAIAVELCRFLEDAHRFEATVAGRNLRSLLHGDLKPRNIRMTSAGKVKVLDFGIAKALSLSRKVTRNDFGSIAYLSPERLESGEVDAHADFWALGVLLYEMLSGVAPFQASDTRRLEKHIIARQPPPSLADRCPSGLEAIVRKLLGPTPADRYASAREIREDLERFASGAPTHAAQEGWPLRVVPPLDEHATRRTRSSDAADEDRTRRTRQAAEATAPRKLSVSPAAVPVAAFPPLPASAAAAAAAKAAAAAAKPAARRVGRGKRFFRFVLFLIGFGIVMHEIRIADAADELADRLPSQEIEQLGDVWTAFDRLGRESYFRMSTSGLEDALVERTTALADRVIANYRTSPNSIRENQWRTARDVLSRAVGVEQGSRRLRAALRYCEGHLHRINGEAQKARNDSDEGQQELTEAVTAFREAAELRPTWPDPFLGLMRTFVYGLEDVDRGADALRQAQRAGYTASDRESAQIADGYRFRGNALVRNAKEVAGTPQERDMLARAAEAYRQSLELYSKSSAVANAASSIRLSQRSLSQVEERLEEIAVLSQPPSGEPVPWP